MAPKFGLNPFYYQPKAAYNTTDPAQSKFYWGPHGQQSSNTQFSSAEWNAGAPQQAWGIQESAKPLTATELQNVMAGYSWGQPQQPQQPVFNPQPQPQPMPEQPGGFPPPSFGGGGGKIGGGPAQPIFGPVPFASQVAGPAVPGQLPMNTMGQPQLNDLVQQLLRGIR
jgi:hypothetical protein